MEKNQEYYLNKINYGDTCGTSNEEVLNYLIKEHFLSEFSTEEEKLQVLENLGITQKIEILQEILTNKADVSSLYKYVTLNELSGLLLSRARDPKSKGYFSSILALVDRYPVAETDDWAIVNLGTIWYVYKYLDGIWNLCEEYHTDVNLNEYVKLQDLLESWQEKLVPGRNIKTINGHSLLGEGNLVIEGVGGSSDVFATKEELYNIQYPLTVKVTVTPTLFEYTGIPLRVTLTTIATKGNTTVVPESISLKWDNDEESSIEETFQVDITKKGTTTFEVTCKFGLEEVTEIVSVNSVLPTYLGFSTAEDVNNLDLGTLSKRIKSEMKFEEPIQNVTPGSYLWIVSPFILNKVSTDPGFTYKVRMLAADYKNNLYYYRSSSAIDISHLTYYIK